MRVLYDVLERVLNQEVANLASKEPSLLHISSGDGVLLRRGKIRPSTSPGRPAGSGRACAASDRSLWHLFIVLRHQSAYLSLIAGAYRTKLLNGSTDVRQKRFCRPGHAPDGTDKREGTQIDIFFFFFLSCTR